MANDIVNGIQGPFQHGWHLLTTYMDACPDDLWAEKHGGWPIWQQVAHVVAVADFFVPGGEGVPAPCSMESAMLKQQGGDMVDKAGMKAWTARVKARVDAWIASLSDADLAVRNDVLSDRIKREMTLGGTLVLQATHLQYHLGSCDAALRDRGLPGVF